MIGRTSQHHTKKIKLRAQLHRLSFDPAWKIDNAASGHDRIAQLDPDLTVHAALGDITNLKLWNSAFGAQPPLDTIFAAAFASIAIRASDIFCRFDGGDQLCLVVHHDEEEHIDRRHRIDVRAAIDRINNQLKDAPIPDDVRERYVLLACQKRSGPILGHLIARLHAWGIHKVMDHPHIDWCVLPPVKAGGLLATIKALNTELFAKKRHGR